MKVYIDFPRENLTNAIESSRIGYWATNLQRVRPLTYNVRVAEGEAWYELTPTRIEEGIQRMAEKCPHKLAGLLDPLMADETTGDVLIQYAIFGKLRYA